MNKYLSQCDTNLVALNTRSRSSMSHLLGITFTAIGPDFMIGEMPVDDRTRQPYGLLHGGASIVLAETLGSVGSTVLAGQEEGTRVVGVEVSGSHLRGVRSGKVTGVCRALKLGRSMQFWQISIYDQEWQLCCSARLAVNVSHGPVPAGAG